MSGIVIEGLSKSYGVNNVLKKINLTISEPGLYLIAGPNGSGKTTFLEILIGLRDFDEGSVSIENMNPGNINLKKHIGFLAQQNSLRKSSKVIEEVQLIKELYSIDVDIIKYLSKYNLHNYLNNKTSQLSGGTKRRLLIAMSLMPQHNIVILDEPASGLDTSTRDEIWNSIKDCSKDKIVIVSDHYLNEAAQYSDYTYLLNKGIIALEGRTEQLLKNFDMKYVIKTRTKHIETLKAKINGYIDTYELKVSGTVCNVFLKSDSNRISNLMAKIRRDFNVHSANLEDIYFYITGDVVREEGGVIV